MRKLVFFIFAVLLLLQGCEKSSGPDNTGPDRNVVSENLYQGQDMVEAISFMGIPAESQSHCRNSIVRRGQFASGKELEFANMLLEISRTKNVDEFESLLSSRMNNLLAENNKETFASKRVAQVREGFYLDSQCNENYYGQCDAKFVALFNEFDMKPFEKFENSKVYFPHTPTHRLEFVHFHKPNYAVFFDPVYLARDGADYKIVIESTKGSVPEFTKPQKVFPVALSGIEKTEAVNYSGKNYQIWHVGLTETDNKANRFEIVNFLEEVNDSKPQSEPAEQVLFSYDRFEKFSKIWDDIRFKFTLNTNYSAEEFAKDSGKLKCVCSIASATFATELKYSGNEISNVTYNKIGIFQNNNLKLLSFDSKDDTDTVYRNTVFVRLIPKSE